jgi:hypothetical protein
MMRVVPDCGVEVKDTIEAVTLEPTLKARKFRHACKIFLLLRSSFLFLDGHESLKMSGIAG